MIDKELIVFMMYAFGLFFIILGFINYLVMHHTIKKHLKRIEKLNKKSSEREEK